ncbi:hypothetical protein MGN70_010615 [Eutypa lata]|uniref:Uncharacterized protein n=1 Tax=Eutypa lata (strain UCR-EL1) TaxID=1287681 RepID=M7T1N1_EUTLA|nr:hypothetical protein UCREL1_2509 [Eutypa lata UCREL1]KAI1246734.1 hypothetical protein MGN70_010615 [Eutypa lata]
MVSLFKIVMAALPFILQAGAAPSGQGESVEIAKRFCVAPSNCGPSLGDCQFCCDVGVDPNSETCHSHGKMCPNGSTKWHCDDTTR